LSDTKNKLAVVRRYTGDRFSAQRGYDARKPLSRARLKTIDRYFEMIQELTARPHKVVTPPKGGKREAFEYTGQIHHPRFTKAIVHTPDPAAKYVFELDKSRPKGSRFIVTNRRTREKSWHIPAAVFLDENAALFDEDEDTPPEFFADVLEEYGEAGEVYLIEAGDYHMWGAAGSVQRVSEKLSDLFKQYGAGNFDAMDKSSHFIGNWFRGVQVYSDARDFRPYLEDRVRAEGARLRERGLEPFTKHRVMKSGAIGTFHQGRLVAVHQAVRRPYVCPTCHKRFDALSKLTRHRRQTGH
jgi:hypothetical protein